MKIQLVHYGYSQNTRDEVKNEVRIYLEFKPAQQSWTFETAVPRSANEDDPCLSPCPASRAGGGVHGLDQLGVARVAEDMAAGHGQEGSPCNQ